MTTTTVVLGPTRRRSAPAELRRFSSPAGEHAFVVDGSRIYDLDASASAAGDDDLLAALGVATDPAQRYIGTAPLEPPPLTSISLNVMQSCNMSCGYCYADEGRFGGAARRMTVDVARRTVDRLVAEAAPGTDLVVGFMGGEPLLNRPVVHDATRYAADVGRRTGHRVRFSLTTNLTLLRAEDVELFAEHPFTVTVSLDGDRDGNDRQRRMRDGSSAYARVRAGLALIDRFGRPSHLAARITATPRTGALLPVVDHLVALGFDDVGVAPVLVSPDPALAFSEHDFTAFLGHMVACGETALRELRAGRSYPFGNLETALHQIHRGTHRPLPCGAGAAYLSANAEGELFACHRLVDDPAYAMETVAARATHLARSHVDTIEPCRGCWARYLCGGGCHHEVSRRGRVACDYIRGWLEFCLRAYVELSGARPEYFDPTGSCRVKIFPRNLTARADYVVRGNPASSRTESGVDNCYPGLEFDQRNLDTRFFPGLVVEFHRPDGAIVVDLLDGSDAMAAGLGSDDLPLFLWALLGPKPDDPTVDIGVSFRDLDGLEAWRHVHDLPPGRVLVLIGPGSNTQALPFDPGIDQQLRQIRDGGSSVVQRNDDGTIQLAALVGERARYLDDDGVIDTEAYSPGDLTRSLCAPWQYDFRDCGCFYWAATKPDVVTSSDGQFPFLNFQRRDRTTFPPPADVSTNSQQRRAAELDYGELVAGAWNDVLAVIVDDRENVPAVRPPTPDVPMMSRQEVVDELAYLATVEHALCVEYLYAHYSLDAPMALPSGSGASAAAVRVFAAAQEVFNIAVDEMRHLRWVNEALNLLGEAPSVGRAERIGRQLDEPFSLEPLTPERLQWFIDVERPSQDLTGALDGMYVRLHTSILGQPDVFPENERLVHLIKLIIDEGDDHFHRFTSIQRHLAGLAPDDYLRLLADGGVPRLVALQDLSDQNYTVVVGALATTFSLGDRAGGILIEQARRAMFNLHEVNHFMAAQGVRARFTIPPSPGRARMDARGAHALVDSLAGGAETAGAAVASSGGADEQQLAARVLERNRELFDVMRRLIDDDLA